MVSTEVPQFKVWPVAASVKRPRFILLVALSLAAIIYPLNVVSDD